MLLGQFGDWGAYTARRPAARRSASPSSKPSKAATEPNRPTKSATPSYAFISTRPAEKVTNEVSVIVGYPQKPSFDAAATMGGSANYVMYTQNDGAWVKNAAEEKPRWSTALRNGADLVVKIRIRPQGHQKSIDTYSLKGLGEALDKVAAECK